MGNMRLLSNMELPAESSGGLSINGPMIVAEFELFGMNITITESITVQWVVMLLLGTLFFALGRDLKIKPDSGRQVLAEMIVTMFSGMVSENMGKRYYRYTSYIGALFCFSLALSLSTLLGFRPPTADISVIAAWGVTTFILVTRNRFKTGIESRRIHKSLLHYINPLNLVSAISNPMSQSLRHYGNILAGVVIGAIIYWACISMMGVALVIPAAVSLYFDMFSAVLQAFIFVTLTMVYVAMADVGPEG